MKVKQLPKIIQSGGFLTSMTCLDKTANGLASSLMPMAKESVNMGGKGALVNAGLSLLVKKDSKEHLWIRNKSNK